MFITNLPERRSYNCYSGNICYLLERKNVVLSEHISFGLSGGLNFAFSISDKISFRAVRELHCLTEYIYGLGVKVIEHQEDTYEELIAESKKMLDLDLPFMFEYDGFYLPFTQIYNRTHERRIAIIIGYDEENIYISDFIYGAYKVPVQKKLFEQSVDKKQGSCVDFRWYDVEFPEDINSKVTDKVIWKTIQDVCNNFLSTDRSNFNNNSGIEGMRLFSSNLEQIFDMAEKQELQVDWKDFSEDIKQAVITLQHYALFLNDISEKQLIKINNKEALKKSVDLIREASDSWRVVCSLFFKLGVLKNRDLLVRIQSNINKTADLLDNSFKTLQLLYYQEGDKLCTY